MRKNIKKLPIFSVIALLLVVSFWWGENTPVEGENQASHPRMSYEGEKSPAFDESREKQEKITDSELPAHSEKKETAVVAGEENPTPTNDKPALTEKNVKQNAPQVEEKLVCSFSVSCSTVLDNIDRLALEKHSLIPSDGVLYQKGDVAFCDGDTVFDVLLREMAAANIHMEFVKTPLYGNVYIEGIGNLYEFDCGELSGWMYRVNGSFPNFGCDSYKLSLGDKVEWIYTCNLGRDVGGDYFAQNGQ